jgi:hypothetical protein
MAMWTWLLDRHSGWKTVHIRLLDDLVKHFPGCPPFGFSPVCVCNSEYTYIYIIYVSLYHEISPLTTTVTSSCYKSWQSPINKSLLHVLRRPGKSPPRRRRHGGSRGRPHLPWKSTWKPQETVGAGRFQVILESLVRFFLGSIYWGFIVFLIILYNSDYFFLQINLLWFIVFFLKVLLESLEQ